jgi:hypothetical protein
MHAAGVPHRVSTTFLSDTLLIGDSSKVPLFSQNVLEKKIPKNSYKN